MSDIPSPQDPAPGDPHKAGHEEDPPARGVPAGASRPQGTQFPPGSVPQPSGKERRKRGRRVALISVVVVIALLGAGIYALADHITSGIRHVPNAFQGVNRRPALPPATNGSMNILIAGSDLRSAARATGTGARNVSFQPGQQRSDVLMLLHINANRRQASFISIPRDSWVDVPGHGMMKINAALSLGGPPLMIRTVEDLTHLVINHYAVVGFQGFKDMVAALGKVQVQVAHTTSSQGVTFRKGTDTLTPRAALAYVRQRIGLPAGDLSRIQRQQNLIRAIITGAEARHMLSNPATVYRLLGAVTHAVSFDSGFTTVSMASFLFQLKYLNGNDISFVTAPWSGFATRDGQAVVLLNRAQCTTLWQAVRKDRVAAWVSQHPSTATPSAPN